MIHRPALILSLMLAACGADRGPGELSIAVYGEDFIERGIPAGQVIDGWAVRFDRFELEIGAITAARGEASPDLVVAGSVVVDIAADSGGAGVELAAAEVPGGVYDRVSYRIGAVEVDGVATRGDEVVRFDWIFDTPTRYADCLGTAVVDGGDARLELTVHGDHLFYDDLISSTPNVAFDLIAGADAGGDRDGTVTRAELEAVDIRGEERYQVGNFDVTDLWAFIDRQVSTVGHIDGEGHCAATTRE